MNARYTRPLFSIGRVVATPGVVELNLDIHGLVARHQRGDWGCVGREDEAANDEALRTGERVLSSFAVQGRRIWVITEADRSTTTVLLPSEY